MINNKDLLQEMLRRLRRRDTNAITIYNYIDDGGRYVVHDRRHRPQFKAYIDDAIREARNGNQMTAAEAVELLRGVVTIIKSRGYFIESEKINNKSK